MGNLLTVDQVRLHLDRAQSEDDYSAVNTLLWIGLVKAAQEFEGNQGDQGQALIDALDPKKLEDLLQSEGVEAHISLDPPIESIVTYPMKRITWMPRRRLPRFAASKSSGSRIRREPHTVWRGCS
jgi:hypothetical protein